MWVLYGQHEWDGRRNYGCYPIIRCDKLKKKTFWWFRLWISKCIFRIALLHFPLSVSRVLQRRNASKFGRRAFLSLSGQELQISRAWSCHGSNNVIHYVTLCDPWSCDGRWLGCSSILRSCFPSCQTCCLPCPHIRDPCLLFRARVAPAVIPHYSLVCCLRFCRCALLHEASTPDRPGDCIGLLLKYME